MKDFLDKLYSYNIFNFLLPGTIFIIILNRTTHYSFDQADIIAGAFVYYFVGLVISRVGSLVVEPILKKISFIKFADYREFVSASKKDERIDLLSESNNTFRTIIAMFILLILLKLWELVELKIPMIKIGDPYILIGALLILFLYSYRKQTDFITKRIKANK